MVRDRGSAEKEFAAWIKEYKRVLAKQVAEGILWGGKDIGQRELDPETLALLDKKSRKKEAKKAKKGAGGKAKSKGKKSDDGGGTYKTAKSKKSKKGGKSRDVEIEMGTRKGKR